MTTIGECPYCLEPVYSAGEATTCDSCGAVHHIACWVENGGCCVRICGKASRNLEIDVETTRPEALVLSKEAVESAMAYSGRANSNPCITCGRQVPEGELHCADCAPQPEEDLNTGRVGPLLVIIAVVGVVLAWIIVAAIVPGMDRQDGPKKSDTRIETSR